MRELHIQPAAHPHHIGYFDNFADTLAGIDQVRSFSTDYSLLQEPFEYAVKRFEAFESDKNPNTLFIPFGGGSNGQTVANDFIASPLTTSSSKRSQHGLFFSRLDSPTRRLRVAVKPFYTDIAVYQAVSEQIKIQAFRDLGMTALRPFGVVIGDKDSYGNQHAYGLTALHDGLTTLDSIDWSGFAADPNRNPGMTEIWKSVARESALMHSTGQVSHKDFEARNLATSVSQLGFPIDNETAYLSHEKPRDAETRYGNSLIDLDTLLLSMSMPRRMPGTNFEGLNMFGPKVKDWYGAYCNIFLNDYLSERKKLAHGASRSDKRDIDEELAQLQVVLKQKADLYREKILEAQKR